MASPKHFLDLSAVTAGDLRGILEDAKSRKQATKAGTADKPLAGKMLAMIFEKPSTRTRISFDVGMRQLGGETIFLTGAEMQLSREETLSDTAKVMSRYVDAIMIRTDDHAKIEELGAACVFVEPQFEPKLISVVTEGTQAKSGVLDPEGGALEAGPGLYGQLMRNLSTSMSTCLSQ